MARPSCRGCCSASRMRAAGDRPAPCDRPAVRCRTCSASAPLLGVLLARLSVLRARRLRDRRSGRGHVSLDLHRAASSRRSRAPSVRRVGDESASRAAAASVSRRPVHERRAAARPGAQSPVGCRRTPAAAWFENRILETLLRAGAGHARPMFRTPDSLADCAAGGARRSYAGSSAMRRQTSASVAEVGFYRSQRLVLGRCVVMRRAAALVATLAWTGGRCSRAPERADRRAII